MIRGKYKLLVYAFMFELELDQKGKDVGWSSMQEVWKHQTPTMHNRIHLQMKVKVCLMYLTNYENSEADDNDDDEIDFWPQIDRRRATVHRADVFCATLGDDKTEHCEIVCTDLEIFFRSSTFIENIRSG